MLSKILEDVLGAHNQDLWSGKNTEEAAQLGGEEMDTHIQQMFQIKRIVSVGSHIRKFK